MVSDNRAKHRNQFFLCESSLDVTPPNGFRQVNFAEDIDIYYSDLLPFYRISSGDAVIAFVGEAVIPDGPSIQDWLEESVIAGLDGVLRRSQALTGRYTIVYSDGDSTTVVPDPIAHKSIFYHTELEVVTSSLKLLFDSVDIEQTEIPRVAEFMDSAQFDRNEMAFVGDKTPFESLRCLLPNHVLDVDEMDASRRPLFTPDVQQAPQYIADRIAGTVKAFNDKRNLRTPLTAGRDTRTILACSKDILPDVYWYTLSPPAEGEIRDVRIPKKIASEQNFDYSIHHPRALDDDFRTTLNENLVWTRELPKTRNVQFLYNTFDVENDLYVTGAGGEILRSYYDTPDPDVDLVEYACSALRYPDDEFVRDEVEAWLPGATEYAEEYDIPLADLLYWEQRMGRWGSLALREKDIAVRGISPFSNYDLLLAGLDVERDRRSPPDYDLTAAIIRAKWPELLQYEFNPSENPLKARIARTAPKPVAQLLRRMNGRISN